MTPWQFQKRLRLYTVREGMIGQGVGAAAPTFEVSYESPSHFNREYKRLLGISPSRATQPLRRTSAAVASSAPAAVVASRGRPEQSNIEGPFWKGKPANLASPDPQEIDSHAPNNGPSCPYPCDLPIAPAPGNRFNLPGYFGVFTILKPPECDDRREQSASCSRTSRPGEGGSCHPRSSGSAWRRATSHPGPDGDGWLSPAVPVRSPNASKQGRNLKCPANISAFTGSSWRS